MLNLFYFSSSFCFSFSFSISVSVDGTNRCHHSNCRYAISPDVVHKNMHHIPRDDVVHNVDENDSR